MPELLSQGRMEWNVPALVQMEKNLLVGRWCLDGLARDGICDVSGWR